MVLWELEFKGWSNALQIYWKIWKVFHEFIQFLISVLLHQKLSVNSTLQQGFISERMRNLCYSRIGDITNHLYRPEGYLKLGVFISAIFQLTAYIQHPINPDYKISFKRCWTWNFDSYQTSYIYLQQRKFQRQQFQIRLHCKRWSCLLPQYQAQNEFLLYLHGIETFQNNANLTAETSLILWSQKLIFELNTKS